VNLLLLSLVSLSFISFVCTGNWFPWWKTRCCGTKRVSFDYVSKWVHIRDRKVWRKFNSDSIRFDNKIFNSTRFDPLSKNSKSVRFDSCKIIFGSVRFDLPLKI
jgi:hypothetical protein